MFKVAFERWIAPGEERPMRQLIRESLTELKAVASELRVPGALA